MAAMSVRSRKPQVIREIEEFLTILRGKRLRKESEEHFSWK
jgi:hypothetical protein